MVSGVLNNAPETPCKTFRKCYKERGFDPRPEELEETHKIPKKEPSPSGQAAGGVVGLHMLSAGGLGTDFMAERQD